MDGFVIVICIMLVTFVMLAIVLLRDHETETVVKGAPEPAIEPDVVGDVVPDPGVASVSSAFPDSSEPDANGQESQRVLTGAEVGVASISTEPDQPDVEVTTGTDATPDPVGAVLDPSDSPLPSNAVGPPENENVQVAMSEPDQETEPVDVMTGLVTQKPEQSDDI